MAKHTTKPIKNAKVLKAPRAPLRTYKAGQWGTFGAASPCVVLVANGVPVKQD